MIVLWLATGVLAKGGEAPAFIPARGDDAGYFKRPVLDYIPKKRALEQVLELVEDISPSDRISVKRREVRAAKATFAEIDLPPDYSASVIAISKSLRALAKSAGEYRAFQEASMRAAQEIRALIEALERKRLKRRREEEAVIAWLLN